MVSVFIGIRGITIPTPQVAPGEPDEYAWPPGECAFSLDAVKDFVDVQHG